MNSAGAKGLSPEDLGPALSGDLESAFLEDLDDELASLVAEVRAAERSRIMPGPGSGLAALLEDFTITSSPWPSPTRALSQVVHAVSAGRRLEAWSLWCQLVGIGRLL